MNSGGAQALEPVYYVKILELSLPSLGSDCLIRLSN